MHKSDGVDNMNHCDGKLGRQLWTGTPLVIDTYADD